MEFLVGTMIKGFYSWMDGENMAMGAFK